MPNWKKVIVSGSNASLNSLIVDNGITGSLFGTASFATNANLLDGKDSSEFATTGSNTFIGNQIITGSLNITGSTTQTGNNTLIGNTTLSGSIIISGSQGPGSPTASVQIYGDIRQSGYHRFDPVTTNIDTSISASYIYVSGSTQDLYFTENSKGYSNTVRLRWLEGNLYTGLLHGGLITTQSSTVYQVSSGSGIIVDLNASLNDDPYPTIQYLNWGNLSASIAPLTASYQQAFVSIDSTGNIYQQGTPYVAGQFDTEINIGVVLFQNQSTINGVKTQPSTAYGFEQNQNIFNRAFGPLKLSGFTLAPSGSSTGSLVVGSGTAYSPGSNYTIDPNNPSYATDSGTNTSKIFRYYQSGSTWVYQTNAGAGFGAIDPTQYSNNGVLTAVPAPANSNWTIQRVFWFPNSVAKAIVVYYGNAYYGSEAEAIANINIEPFVEAPNTAANAIYLGAIVINGSGVFTSANDFTIVPGGLFRQVGGSGGGGSIITQTLSGLSDVNISGPTNYQPLVYSTTQAKWINASVISASIYGNADTATSASFVTASNVYGPYGSNSVLTASFAQTASYAKNIEISGAISNVDYIDFDLSASFADAVGRLGYNSGEGTLQFGLAGGNVMLNVGEDLFQYVYNNSGGTLTKGQVVYISGSQGNRIAVKLASATAEQGSANTLGFVAETINAGAEGWVQTEGTLRGLNTTGLIGGQLIFLSSSAGQYTQTPPVAPNHGVRLGYAERINATVGSIYIKIDNGYELGELHDVIDNTTTSSYGDLLVKSGSVWTNSKQLTGSYGLTGSLTATSLSASSLILTNNATITGSLTILQNLTVLGSASITYVSESTLNIGTNLITVNTNLPGSRFGGLAVIDSGSSPQVSGSWLFDSLQNRWIFLHQQTAGPALTSSIGIMGPETYNNIGNETQITLNRLTKGYSGASGEHIGDSQISDDGTTVSIPGNLIITGSITGSLFGTSSWATNAVSSSYPFRVTGSTIYSYNANVSVGSVKPTSNGAIIIGQNAGTGNSKAEYSVFLGTNAGSGSVNEENIAIGRNAGASTLSAVGIFIGKDTGYNNTGQNTAIGEFAGYDSNNSYDSNFIGIYAGAYATNAYYSNFIGDLAGQRAKDAQFSNFMGLGAGENAVSASYGVFLGYNAGSAATTASSVGSYNIIIGNGITLPTRYTRGVNIGGLIFGSGSYNPGASYFSGSANGRIGINQPDPQFSLDVSGSGRYTNGLTISGSTTITGSLGVGTTGSAVVGRIDASNDVVAFATSDINLKENLKPIANALYKLDNIQGYTFDWKKDEKLVSQHGFTGRDVGVIAQEIEEILPEVVITRDSGYKAVKYEKLVPFLIQCIKELKDEIEILKGTKKPKKTRKPKTKDKPE